MAKRRSRRETSATRLDKAEKLIAQRDADYEELARDYLDLYEDHKELIADYDELADAHEALLNKVDESDDD